MFRSFLLQPEELDRVVRQVREWQREPLGLNDLETRRELRELGYTGREIERIMDEVNGIITMEIVDE